MTTQVMNITVSIPRNLVMLADRVAKERKVSRSSLVASCLKVLADRQLQEQLEEGYAAMAKENMRLANMAVNSVHEVLPK